MRERNASAPASRFALRWARLAAGIVALTTATLGAGLAVTAMPAYADVTTSDYTIGTPTGAVGGVAATPSSVGEGTYTNFEVSFTAATALSGTSDSWVSVGPSEDLASTPVNVDLIGSGCVQSGTSGAGGLGAATVAGMTVELGSSCSIASGATVEVDFNADAPTATGSFDFTVTTSSNGTQATSNAITVGTSGVALSASTYGFGANATYTITDAPVVNLSASENTLILTAGVTGGSETITFYAGASGYTVTYAPTGGATTSDTVETAAISANGQIVTLTLANSLPSGDMLNITADGTNPAPSSTTQSNDISVAPGNGTVEPTNSVTFGDSVSNVTATPSTLLAGASATYSVSFKASDAVGAGEDVFLSETAGPTNFAGVTGIEVADATQSWHLVATGASLADGSADIPLSEAIVAGDSITITLVNVTNPPARTVSDFAVSTSSDSVPTDAPAYTIGTNASPGVVVSVNPSTTGALATYTFTNLRASAAMTGGSSTITLEAPAGTVFPNNAGSYSIADSTTSSGSGTVTGSVSGGGSNDVEIIVPENIASGDLLTLTVLDVINPGTASSTYSAALFGNVTGPSAAAPFPHANVAYPNGAIVGFSGTDYVFAGGHAFEVTGSAQLTALEKVDHAEVQTAVGGASPPSGTLRAGTLVFTRPVNGNATIYVAGADGELHGFATPAQFVNDGYDPALVVTVPSVSGVTVGRSAGAEGSTANALSTSADGAIVVSGGAYYVFAGSRAFGIPTPAFLATVKTADKAKALSGTVSTAQKSGTIAGGVVLSARGPVYVSYEGELWPFKSMAQLATDGYGGTAAVPVPGSGGIAVGTYGGS